MVIRIEIGPFMSCDYYSDPEFEMSLCDSELCRMTDGRRRTYYKKYFGMEVFKTFHWNAKLWHALASGNKRMYRLYGVKVMKSERLKISLGTFN
jgi:hypothetical protein